MPTRYFLSKEWTDAAMPHIVWHRKENCVAFNEQNDRKQEKK